jgi:hypothetical protein
MRASLIIVGFFSSVGRAVEVDSKMTSAGGELRRVQPVGGLRRVQTHVGDYACDPNHSGDGHYNGIRYGNWESYCGFPFNLKGNSYASSCVDGKVVSSLNAEYPEHVCNRATIFEDGHIDYMECIGDWSVVKDLPVGAYAGKVYHCCKYDSIQGCSYYEEEYVNLYRDGGANHPSLCDYYYPWLYTDGNPHQFTLTC